ncbi:MAG: DUF6496 domain-containing protein [Candidatus Pacearchaeota archaeon]
MKKKSKEEKKIESVMSEWKKGELHSGKSKKIVPKSRQDQAIAIALSVASKIKKGK